MQTPLYPLESRRMYIMKPFFLIKVACEKRAGGYPPAPARDWYIFENPAFEIRTFLASTGTTRGASNPRFKCCFSSRVQDL